MDFTTIFLLILGLVIGFALGWLFKSSKHSTDIDTNNEEVLGEKINSLIQEKGILSGRLENATEVFKQQKEQLDVTSNQKDKLIAEIAHFKSTNENLQEKLTTQKEEVENLQNKFQIEFTNIANKLLKQNSTDFADANQKRLGEILNPLSEKIKSFEEKVENKHIKDVESRSSLIEQIKSLKDLNVQMSEEAQNLTKALKGDNKAQGNWGELILEKVLESSGLIEGEEYEAQHSTTNEEGSRLQPDIVVNLPDDKHIIVDAKVSLTAYQQYVNSENKEEQEVLLKNHLLSVKSHIKGLSEKNYASANGINSPDFVLLFMPIESSFGLAMRTDNDLYQYAWDKKVVIVTPSTLLATLKTIKSVWNNEKQTKNAIEIARQAGALHDKFVGFVEDMEKIKKSLDQSTTSYDKAFNKLKDGKGNLIDATLRLEKLGAKTKKQIPVNLQSENPKQLED